MITRLPLGAKVRRTKGIKHEARFVQESDVRPATVSLAEDARELISLPAFTFLDVAFRGTPLRLVAGLVQVTVEQPTDVFGVVLDAEMPLDEKSNPSGSPQLIGETVGRCPLQQKLFQFAQLSVGESALGTGSGLCSEAISLAPNLRQRCMEVRLTPRM